MGFLNTDSMPRLVEKLADGDNIKITGNSKGSKVGTVVKKIVEKADDVTKAIEQEVVNDSYSFKVGTGDVDVSADVEDGFSEVGVKGVTYQNLFNSLEIEPHFSTTVVGSRFKTIVAETPTHQYGNISIPISELYKFKPNHKYTLFVNITKNTFVNKDGEELTQRAFCINTYNFAGNMIESSNEGNYSLTFEQGVTGMKKCVITTKNFDNPSNPINSCFDLYIGSYYTKAGCELSGEFIIVEGDHINNPNIPSYFEGIVGVGDKSKNLFNPQKIADDLGLDVVSEGLVVNKAIGDRLYIDSITPKPNTVYHISIQEYLPITTNGTWSPVIGFEYTDGTNYESYTYTGLTTLTSSAKSVHKFYIRNPFPNVSGCWKNVHIVESKIATQYEPYYDGYKIDILSNTRSVSNEDFLNHVASFGISNIKCEKYLGKLRFTTMGAYYEHSFADKRTLRLIPNTKYTLKMIIDVDTPSTYIIAGALNKTKITNNHYEFTTDSTGMVAIYPFSTGTSFVNVPFDIVIEPSDSFPNDLNYKEYKSQILLDEPLMRLPNGVCDEITRDGKLIRRVGRTILDGSRNWITSDSGGEYLKGCLTLPIELGSEYTLCDNLISENKKQAIGYNPNRESVWVWNTSNGVNYMYISIKKSKLISNDNVGIKNYLIQNPTTVYYQLATPIITDVIPLSLRMFKDGRLTFNTTVAPESNHVVQLNKSAQIERSIREVQSLDSRVGKLESFYDDMMLETSHKLSLLNYDFEYTRERNGE